MWKEFLQDICQLVQMSNGKYVDYLTFCFTIATTMFASGISVLTLTISFIANKRDALKNLIYNMQQNGTSLSYAKQIEASQRYIKKMKAITNMAIYATAISLISILLYCVFKAIQPTFVVHILGLSVLASILFIALCIYKLCKWYFTK